jgi:multidrug efflux system outer membrane protein
MAGFDAEWELDLFGKYRRSLEAAHDDAEAQMELRSAALITVIADVAREYFEIRALQRRLEIVRRNVATAQRTVGLIGARSSGHEQSKSSESSSREQFKSSGRGQSIELDIDLAERELATQEAKLPELETTISDAESRLAVLLGTYSADIAEATKGAARMPHLPAHLRPGVPVDLLRRRPDIRAAERELAAATARIGITCSRPCRSRPVSARNMRRSKPPRPYRSTARSGRLARLPTGHCSISAVSMHSLISKICGPTRPL